MITRGMPCSLDSLFRTDNEDLAGGDLRQEADFRKPRASTGLARGGTLNERPCRIAAGRSGG
ncbi:hypothetical protein ACRPH4_06320 [Pantoea allii]|uniref:hypothetical protein n=1 Tax=Pantoea TaxID=53335 RepID=UPI000A82BE64|nr:hypothetical protein [Pantoea sp. OXWO6B1]